MRDSGQSLADHGQREEVALGQWLVEAAAVVGLPEPFSSALGQCRDPEQREGPSPYRGIVGLSQQRGKSRSCGVVFLAQRFPGFGHRAGRELCHRLEDCGMVVVGVEQDRLLDGLGQVRGRFRVEVGGMIGAGRPTPRGEGAEAVGGAFAW